MPKGGKKGQKKNAYVNLSCTDIKLEDFANSQVSSIRRKPTVNSLAREVKNLCTLERSWLEKGIATTESFSTDTDDETDAVLCEKRKSKSKVKDMVNGCDVSGVTYPVDLWFLIAEYVRPEDVKIFATLCKASYFVSRTYAFWIGLYKRYYKAGTQLPLRLQPHCIERPHCLKVSVIRSLYYFYPHFSTQITSQHSKEIYKLLKFVCVSMWHAQNNNKWLFCFKFKSRAFSTRSNLSSEDDCQRKWCHWDTYEYRDPQQLINDVNRNPEEGCKILKITSPHFVAAPVVMGGHLADIKIGLARDMIKQKLQLVFSFSNYKQSCKSTPSVVSRNCGGSGEILEFDPVENVVVLDWWHPQYPTGNTFL